MVAIALAACGVCAAIEPVTWASAVATGDDPAGRGLQLLQARETALGSQTAQASETARRRGRLLYRLLLHAAAERRSGAAGLAPGGDASAAQVPGGRAISLGVAVLARDLDEEAVLRGELERVREERRSAVDAVDAADAPAAGGDAVDAAPSTPARLRAPVVGAIVAPWGVARDEATGAWYFRTAAGYAPPRGTPVVAPAEGRVVRVADDVGGGRAVVLVHPRGLTTVLGGLATVSVAPRELVRAGAPLGTAGPRVRVEVSRRRTPVDPAALFVPSRGRTARAVGAARPR